MDPNLTITPFSLAVSFAVFFPTAQAASLTKRDTYSLMENCLFYFSINDQHRLEKDFDCYHNTTKSEAASVINKAVTKTEQHDDLRIRIHLADGESYSPEVFQPIATTVLIFGLYVCQSPTVTSKLPSLNFNHMERFSLQDCHNLQIKKRDFSPLQSLKVIYFGKSTIASLEPGTFFDLLNLVVLGLEFGWGFEKSFSAEQNTHLRKFHCNCEYKWFWNGLQGKPFGNITDGEEQWMVPVDCSKNQWSPRSINWNQTKISVNTSC